MASTTSGVATLPLPLLLLVFLLTATTPTFLSPCHSSRPPFACAPGSPSSTLPFCRANLPIHARVRDLLSRLTVDEKVLMLVNNAAGPARLGISRYEWWSEALHGVSNTGPGVHFGGAFPGATSFPQVISSAAAFNASLWELVGKAVSDEARAMYNGGQAGLTFWSPNVNIFRDPRWGRGQETPGEDPLLAAKYAAAYVRGLQQPYAGNRLKLAACCKHYTAYDLDNWKGTDRFHFDARVTRQDLEDTFNVPFEACVREGQAAAVMCSYNQVNGVPTCADKGLLLDTVRGSWGLAGYVASDCDSVGVFYDDQHYAPNPAAAAADAIKAGLDLDCGPFLALHTAQALHQNLLTMPDVDNALANTVTVQMRLGMYDGDPASGPFAHLGPRDVCTPANQFLALEAARQGVVLLRNDRATLPLSPPRLRSVAVIGPNADATLTMIANYAGVPCGYTSPLQGISRYVRTVVHQPGCTDVACAGTRQPVDAAVFAANQADATILVVGLDRSVEAEARDRVSLLLPGRQQELITKVATASRGPVVLVLMCGGPVDITFAKEDPRISAILWVGYPGQAGGAAIADAVFGAFNPGGRLPVTWYPQAFVDRIPMTDMAMRADPARNYPGRTYRFYDGPVVYPFGHGLSYTTFRHTIAQAPASLSVQLTGNRAASYNSTASSSAAAPMVGQAVRVTHARCDGLVIPLHVDVANDGARDGAHTLLVFSSPPAQAKEDRGGPTRQLVAFDKVHVLAGSQTRVEFAIDVCRDLSFADSTGVRRIPIGEHRLQIGELTHPVSVLVHASAHL